MLATENHEIELCRCYHCTERLLKDYYRKYPSKFNQYGYVKPGYREEFNSELIKGVKVTKCLVLNLKDKAGHKYTVDKLCKKCLEKQGMELGE